MKTALSLLIERWKTEGIKLLPPEPPSAVEALFARLGTRPARDIVWLYSQLGGMDDLDAVYWRLWPLNEVAQRSAQGNRDLSEFGVLFSDYLIDCWAFRARMVSAERSEVYIEPFSKDKTPRLVATSLDEFFTTYIESPDEVLDW